MTGKGSAFAGWLYSSFPIRKMESFGVLRRPISQGLNAWTGPVWAVGRYNNPFYFENPFSCIKTP